MTMVPDADQRKKPLYEPHEIINSLPGSIFYLDEGLLLGGSAFVSGQ
jgi:hypothetical protein